MCIDVVLLTIDFELSGSPRHEFLNVNSNSLREGSSARVGGRPRGVEEAFVFRLQPAPPGLDIKTGQACLVARAEKGSSMAMLSEAFQALTNSWASWALGTYIMESYYGRKLSSSPR